MRVVLRYNSCCNTSKKHLRNAVSAKAHVRATNRHKRPCCAAARLDRGDVAISHILPQVRAAHHSARVRRQNNRPRAQHPAGTSNSTNKEVGLLNDLSLNASKRHALHSRARASQVAAVDQNLRARNAARWVNALNEASRPIRPRVAAAHNDARVANNNHITLLRCRCPCRHVDLALRCAAHGCSNPRKRHAQHTVAVAQQPLALNHNTRAVLPNPWAHTRNVPGLEVPEHAARVHQCPRVCRQHNVAQPTKRPRASHNNNRRRVGAVNLAHSNPAKRHARQARAAAKQVAAPDHNHRPALPARRAHRVNHALSKVREALSKLNKRARVNLNAHRPVARRTRASNNNNLALSRAHNRRHAHPSQAHARHVLRAAQQVRARQRHTRAPLPNRRRHAADCRRRNVAERVRPQLARRPGVRRNHNAAAHRCSLLPGFNNNKRVVPAHNLPSNHASKRHLRHTRAAAQKVRARNLNARPSRPARRLNSGNRAPRHILKAQRKGHLSTRVCNKQHRAIRPCRAKRSSHNHPRVVAAPRRVHSLHARKLHPRQIAPAAQQPLANNRHPRILLRTRRRHSRHNAILELRPRICRSNKRPRVRHNLDVPDGRRAARSNSNNLCVARTSLHRRRNAAKQHRRNSAASAQQTRAVDCHPRPKLARRRHNTVNHTRRHIREPVAADHLSTRVRRQHNVARARRARCCLNNNQRVVLAHNASNLHASQRHRIQRCTCTQQPLARNLNQRPRVPARRRHAAHCPGLCVVEPKRKSHKRPVGSANHNVSRCCATRRLSNNNNLRVACRQHAAHRHARERYVAQCRVAAQQSETADGNAGASLARSRRHAVDARRWHVCERVLLHNLRPCVRSDRNVHRATDNLPWCNSNHLCCGC